jgi:hypothetical protein
VLLSVILGRKEFWSGRNLRMLITVAAQCKESVLGAWTAESWVQLPYLSISLSVVLSHIGRGLARAEPQSKESYQMQKKFENLAEKFSKKGKSESGL